MTFHWPLLTYNVVGPIFINVAAQLLGWDDSRTFLSAPWVYWVAVPLAFFAIAWRATGRYTSAMSAIQITPRSDRAIASQAQNDVSRYLARDYQVVGSSDVSGDGFTTVFTYLLSNDGMSYAVATDQVRSIASVFGSRLMVSISHAHSIVHPRELRQRVHEDSMSVIMDAHAKALEALATLGHRPDRLRAEDVLPFSIGVDEASKAYVLGHRWEYFRAMLLGFLGLPMPNSARIRHDNGTRRRVEAWASS